jgi:hypothetical protein
MLTMFGPGETRGAHSPGRVPLVFSRFVRIRGWLPSAKRLKGLPHWWQPKGRLPFLFALAVGAVLALFPGRATAAPHGPSAPPISTRILHVDAGSGDDQASGADWTHALKSLEEVQRRLDDGANTRVLRLAIGWYPGTLSAMGDLRIEGGHEVPHGPGRPPHAGPRAQPSATVLDGLGAGPVVSIRAGRLELSSLSLEGGFATFGGGVRVEDGDAFLHRVRLAGNGHASIGCQDCGSLRILESEVLRGSGAAVELRGRVETLVSLRSSIIAGHGRAVRSEQDAEIWLEDCEVSDLEFGLSLVPPGSEVRQSRARPTPEP